MRFLATIFGIVVFAFLLARAVDYEQAAQAHLVRVPDHPKRSVLENRAASQRENLAHARYVCRRGGGLHKRWACWAASSVIRDNGQGWLRRELRESMNLLRPATVSVLAQPHGMGVAWAWYWRSDTQCVVAHEGGWTSPSISPAGVYAGRFQMDSAFERETRFGARMQARYGRAWAWPPWAQVYHAHEVWSYAGWSRWPTYARYCS